MLDPATSDRMELPCLDFRLYSLPGVRILLLEPFELSKNISECFDSLAEL